MTALTTKADSKTVYNMKDGRSSNGRAPKIKQSKYASRRTGSLLVTPAIVFLGTTFIFPMITILWASFEGDNGFTLEWYATALGTPVYQRLILYTYGFSAVVTLVCLVFGYLLAYAMTTFWKKHAGVIMAGLLLAFWTGMLIRTYAWMVILGSKGIFANTMRAVGIEEPPQMLYNTFGTLVGMANILIPYMVLMLYPVMSRVNPNLMLAAQTLGATRLRAFWRVYVPATIPGIISGCVLVFMITLGFYITPALLGGTDNIMISQIIERQISTLLNWNLAGALSVILMAGTVVPLWIYSRQLKSTTVFGG